jgi:hypothetical protein
LDAEGEICMRKIVVAILVAAAVVAGQMPIHRAAAMTVAAPSQFGLAAANAAPVQQVRWHRWHAHDYHWGRRWYWGWPVPWFHIYIPQWHGWWGWHHHYRHLHHR